MKKNREKEFGVLICTRSIKTEFIDYNVLSLEGEPLWIHINNRQQSNSMLIPYKNNHHIFNI
mgnify:FL=1